VGVRVPSWLRALPDTTPLSSASVLRSIEINAQQIAIEAEQSVVAFDEGIVLAGNIRVTVP